MTIRQAYNAFQIDQQIRGNSPKTVSYYSYCIEPFIAFLGADTAIAALTVRDVQRYALQLRSRPITSNSMKSYIKGLKAFLAWLYGEAYTYENLTLKLRLPRAQRKTIDVLTDEEIRRIFSSFDARTFLGIRNICMCALMVDSGLRKNEVIMLQLHDLHIVEGYMLVNGKGNKQRIVPIGLHTRKQLLKYIAMRPAAAPTDCLFLTKSYSPITACVIERMAVKVRKDCFTPRFHPHLLRHTFATRYLENGGNIYALQQILGHTSLEMVQKYVHLSTHKNVVNFTSCSPLDNLRRA